MLLRRLIEADEAKPGELFVAVWTNGGLVIGHPGLSPEDSISDEAALLGLEAARMLLIEKYNSGRPGAFYLPSNALDELREAEWAAAEADKRAAAEKASATSTPPLTFAEMLTAMIEAQKKVPGQFFTRYSTYPHQSIGHSTWPKPLPIEYMELARLLHSGAVVQPDPTSGELLHVMPRAADVLAEELRLQGDGPLVEAEARNRRYAERSKELATTAGTLARRAVMALLVGIIVVLGLSALLLNSLAPFLVALAFIVYDVITDGFGWSARAAAHKVGEAVEAKVLRMLE